MEKARSTHLKRLSEIKGRKAGSGTLDNTLPATKKMAHLKARYKKKALIVERNKAINKANRQLLQQMTTILTQPGEFAQVYTRAPRSINAIKRMQDLERICNENGRILKGIEVAKPYYDVAGWEKDRVKSAKIESRLRQVKYQGSERTVEAISRKGVRKLRQEVLRSRGNRSSSRGRGRGHGDKGRGESAADEGSAYSEEGFEETPAHPQANEREPSGKGQAGLVHRDEAEEGEQLPPAAPEVEGSSYSDEFEGKAIASEDEVRSEVASEVGEPAEAVASSADQGRQELEEEVLSSSG
ncbi:unnamed protein product [Chrysoparadoxa australica]